ncbi:GNAT family N-acetyltransferase [Bacteroides sp. 519]|uniref:GNAT family N-acetyltransferase n=1 Tax=Bacteroides sp. 519 TaxID=2302937 RepID=UPI0013D785EE|nr:GNAT family N-acetyltransferase [Bacteroides sp. 519]NDV59173.1 N-acetyltransferase [Bacteroides sp. 519]
MDYQIDHNPERNLFTTEVDGRTAFVQYAIHNGCLDVLHTIVPGPIEGRGIASALCQAAYDYAKENNLTPQATCSYAVAWLKRHSVS